MITISLCMIVKDEEALLPRCLESIQGLVEEVIVVDTGSSDRTVELAQQAGAQIDHDDLQHQRGSSHDGYVNFGNNADHLTSRHSSEGYDQPKRKGE